MYGAGGGRAKPERKSGAKEEAVAGGAGGGGSRVELLVFGYACKLFRDDERALAQEQGQHLIPWMGDHKILIDRYDGRGHLHDLSAYDAEYATWNRDYQLSEEEARVEALCDEERYLALHTDLLEEEARQEEEYKRLSEALAEDGNYSAVGFTYGSDYYDPSEPTEEEEPSKQREKNEAESLEENEEPFIAPLGLNVPSDVELPPTAKMHAIIERTANFVCKQGAQFEIMLKAKQARNSQFDFLRFDHYLNPYYKFIQKAMKEGRYTALAENKSEEKKKSGMTSDNEDEDDEEDGNYLHPSLFASKKSNRLEELMKPLKVVDPDHPLAALVRKAQADSSAPAPPSADGTTAQPSQVEYTTDSTVAAMYYSYYMLPDGTYCLAPPPPGIDVATYYSTLPAGVTVSSSPGVTTTAPPPPGTTPPPPPTTAETSSRVTSTTTTTSALAPVAIIPPPPDIQPVIDKLAEYVARNGLKFETSVRAKNDQRFEFLQPWHQYNAYYEFKKQFFLQKEGSSGTQMASTPEEAPMETAANKSSEAGEDGTPEDVADAGGRGSSGGKKEAGSSRSTVDGKLVKASFAPISFAIKAKENDLLPLEKNRVKLDDDSEEDEESRECQESASNVANPSPAAAPPCVVVEEKRPQLTQEELEAKQAKQKLEDRLAAAAREKLAQASKESKEKQLQAERKRKAALFLQTLKNPLPEAEVGKLEESAFSVEEASAMPCPLLAGGRTLPTLEVRPPDRPSSRSRDLPREEEKEKKRKKHKKRSRTRSRSPKYHSSSKSRSRSHSKAKHSLPSAYRTVRRSRSRSRSPRRRAHSPERRREDRTVPTAYRMSSSPGASRKRTRSRSPHEKKKKRRSRSRTKAKARSQSTSPSKQPAQRPTAHSAHSASISPVESRGSSQERSRGVSQEKDGQISSAIVSSVQSKITQEWLSRFGYLPPADPATGQLQTQEELSKAIAAMQQFGGLETTGILDEATLALMKTPRCSLPDLPPGAQTQRKRQAPPPTKWNKRNLSWRVRTFPRDSPLGRDTVRALMYYALKVWSDITPLNFHEVAGNTADIQIDFSKADHNDGYPFDGPGGTVAHAFFPGDHHTAGDTHFDDDEAWTFRSSDAHGMDLFAVAVHEFGHAIGLSHVAAPSSIMQPYYQGPVGDPLRYGLPYEDRVRVWQLYGVRESVSPTTQLDTPEPEEPPLLPEPPNNRSSTPPRKDVPHRCTAHFDAVAQIRGEAFFFKGKYFWRLTRDRHLVSLQPAQMHRFWRGLPLHLDSVDAVYERTSDHKIVFFKGDRYWVFKDNNVEEGYPRPVSDFSLPPGGIDAVFSWAHNDRTYFFKDQLYWRYDDHTRRMDPGYPAQGPLWRGVPSMLDDAMRWSDGASYFFRGQEYWKVLDGELEAAPGYPQSTARDWLVCSEPLTGAEDSGPGPQGHSGAQDDLAMCSCTSDARKSALPSLLPLPLLWGLLWTSTPSQAP